MAFVGKFYKGVAGLGERVHTSSMRNPAKAQRSVLKRLLLKAEHTDFGRAYDFSSLLAEKDLVRAFCDRVPFSDYNSMYEQWWHRTLNGERNVTWPGAVRYFALSSGTSGSPSKQIPVSTDMLNAMRRASIAHYGHLRYHDLPESFFEKQILMLGGSTHLNRLGGRKREGDLSGILTARIPSWIKYLYKPGKEIARQRDWDIKLQKIVEHAPEWDIGALAGVPAWSLILLERIIKHHRLDTIHDLWPNFQVMIHGGVSFDPYRDSFAPLFGREVTCMETYLASEGYIAFETRSGKRTLRMLLRNGIYFEFVPFTEVNFNADGTLKDTATALCYDEVEEGKEYALLLSTCAGAWRYLLGDTVRIVNKEKAEIVITGRTKHFLSLCGEHLSVDNMNQAVREVSAAMQFDSREFTVFGVPHNSLFAHRWFIGTDKHVDKEALKQALDAALCRLNDDYATERQHALEMSVETIPNQWFIDWLQELGKQGGQHKFPRVLNTDQQERWLSFIQARTNE